MLITENKILCLEDLKNIEIINTYLANYNHSKDSVITRKHALNYFFKPKYFGYLGHVFEINKRTLFNYFYYLNNLKTISFNTKILKWIILKGFLEFCMEYYDDFQVIIPKKTIQWSQNHKNPKTNKFVIAEKEDLEKILDYYKNIAHDIKYYLIFRFFIETGIRKGELINLDYDKVNFEKRYIDTKGKTGRKIYYISEDLAKLLKEYIIHREKKPNTSKALFISCHKNRYSPRPFNLKLKFDLKKIGINKNISCHTFRRSLNTHRKLMGCNNEDRKILLNHKTGDVNIESYIVLNYKEYIKLFDKWNPYKNLNF